VTETISSSVKEIKILDEQSIENLKKDLFLPKYLDIKNNIIIIRGTYTGGCHDDHLFELAIDGIFIDKALNKVDMILSHDSKGDDCKKIVRKSLAFDLQPLRNKYQKIHGKKINSLVLDLMGNTIEYSLDKQ
jgi:hypothetical protein